MTGLEDDDDDGDELVPGANSAEVSPDPRKDLAIPSWRSDKALQASLLVGEPSPEADKEYLVAASERAGSNAWVTVRLRCSKLLRSSGNDDDDGDEVEEATVDNARNPLRGVYPSYFADLAKSTVVSRLPIVNRTCSTESAVLN